MFGIYYLFTENIKVLLYREHKIIMVLRKKIYSLFFECYIISNIMNLMCIAKVRYKMITVEYGMHSFSLFIYMDRKKFDYSTFYKQKSVEVLFQMRIVVLWIS